MGIPQAIIEVDKCHKIEVWADHGETYWCRLLWYSPREKGYVIVDADRAMSAAQIEATCKALEDKLVPFR